MKNILLLLFIFFTLSTSATIDSTLGIVAPKKVSKNYKLLAHHLCDSLENDHERVTAIFNWVTNNIKYDVKSINRSKLRTDKPNEVLKRGKTICGGYADLVTAMCKEVGIPAQTIIGYYKGWKFDEGDKFFIPNHAWNAVMINNKWEYIDATAGAGYTSLEPNKFQKLMASINKNKLYSANKPKFIKFYDASYFMPPIEEFREEHLPADPLWQLSDSIMPLKTFEAGKKEITTFNERYAKPQQFSVKLSQINKLPWDEQVLESAKRTYDFNPRYSSMLARKKFVEATHGVVKAVNKRNKLEGRTLLTEAKKELDETKAIQLDQKKKIVAETALLKQKNKNKTASFKEYRQLLDKDNKAKKTAFRTRSKQAEAAISIIAKKRSALKKKRIPNTTQTLAGIKTMPTIKSATSPSLLRLADSIGARKERLEALATTVESTWANVQNLESENKELLNLAVDNYNESDSLLYEETKARFDMHDDYDPEVTAPQRSLKEVRLDRLNPSLDIFIDNVDSIKDAYKKLIALQTARELDLKNNLKSIEQYKRQNDENKAILGLYAPTIAKSQEVRTDYLGLLSDYEKSMAANISLFKILTKAHDRELEFTRLMGLAEEKRNELEADKIKKDAEWLKASNKKTKKVCTNAKKEADRLFRLRHDKKKKKWEKELKKLEARAKADD